MKKCLHQHIKSSDMLDNIKIPGYGNCKDCKYDPINNKKCKGYQEIEINLKCIKVNCDNGC